MKGTPKPKALAKAGRVATGHVRAGTLNRRVSLQRCSGGKDALGQPTATEWVEYANVWGEVLQLNGKEHLGAGEITGLGSASIRIRFRQDVQSGDRAVCQGQVFRVSYPLVNVASRVYVDLVCTENSNQT